MKKVFVICPVRGVSEEETEYIKSYILDKEKSGEYKFHWPPRDTNQDDPIGLNICSQNRLAILTSDSVHIYWTKTSEGSKFDSGMAFAFQKPITLINEKDIKHTDEESLTNIIMSYAKNGPLTEIPSIEKNINVYVLSPSRNFDKRDSLDSYVKQLETEGKSVFYHLRDIDESYIDINVCYKKLAAMKKAERIDVYWDPTDEWIRFDVGMAFGLGKPIHLINREDVKPTYDEKGQKLKKSFNNVLLALDEMYKDMYEVNHNQC